MTKEQSMAISAKIGRIIAEKAPRIRWTTAEMEAFYDTYTADELDEMREIGILHDPAVFFVMQRFLYACGLDEEDGEYLQPLLSRAKCLDAKAFRENPYLAAVKMPDVRIGDITLTTAEYGRGEIFQYAMPDFSEDVVVPCLGFFDRMVKFPAIYEGNVPWMSVCPSEITSMEEPIRRAHGKLLVLGLGLGYYPFMASLSDEVCSIAVVEKNPRVIELFERYLLPQFPAQDKIHVITGDALEFLRGVRAGEYDFCFADIWEGVADGAPLYQAIREHEQRLVGTEFCYWIGEQIRAYLGEKFT